MSKYLFPWKSEYMLDYPEIMPIFILILGILLSVLSWIIRRYIE